MKKSTIIFLKYTNKFINKNYFFFKNKFYFLAFSSGQDSTCLLIIFFILRKQFKIKIHILFCNHLWQKDNFATFFHVLKICFFLNLYISQSLPTTFLENENISRIWRLKIFSKLLFFFNFSGILTGHSLNDQNETFFFNLFRGSGFFGIFPLRKKKLFKNIEKFYFFTKNTFSKFLNLKRQIRIKNMFFIKHKIKKNIFFLENRLFLKFLVVRPFIFQKRNELKNFLIRLNIPIFPDLTNKKTFLSRNRIRKQLIPSIQFFFNKQLPLTIQKYIYVLEEKEKDNLKFIKKLFKKIIYENDNYFFLDLKIFKKFPLTIQKNLILFFFKYKLKKKITFTTFNHFFFIIKNYQTSTKKLKQIKIFFGIGVIFFYSNFIIFLK